jgi:hypothetical protein
MSIISDRRKAIAKARRGGKPVAAAEPVRPTGYENAARAGKTQPGRIEIRDRKHPKFNLEVRPGYMVKMNERVPMNRADRRRQGQIRPKPRQLRKSRALYPSIVTAEASHKRLIQHLLPTPNQRKAQAL